MTKLEEKATEFAKTEFHRPYSDTPEEAIVIVEPDKYKGFIGGYKEALEEVKKECERCIAIYRRDNPQYMRMAINQCIDLTNFIDNLTK